MPLSTPVAVIQPAPSKASAVENRWPSSPSFADSVFTVPLLTNPKIAPQSTSMLSSYGAIHLTIGSFDVKPTVYDTASPLYLTKSSDPVFTIHCDAWAHACPSLEGHRIHIPSYAKWGSWPEPNCDGCGGHGSYDAHMALISPDGNEEYDLYEADRFPGKNGGTFVISSGELYPLRFYNEFGPPESEGASTASRRALTAGVVWPEELLSGRIPHALIVGPPCVNGTSVFPAHGDDGLICDKRGGLPEGARLWLDMSEAQIQALPVSQIEKIFYTAMAQYGLYVTDTSGGNDWYVGGGPSRFTYTDIGLPDPWPAVAAKYGYRWSNHWLKFSGFSSPLNASQPAVENALRVLDPCVTARSC